jgi:hypothetical protein
MRARLSGIQTNILVILIDIVIANTSTFSTPLTHITIQAVALYQAVVAIDIHSNIALLARIIEVSIKISINAGKHIISSNIAEC